MEFLRPTVKQRLSYATCAIALVYSLSAYKSSIGDEIGKVIKNIWHPNPELTV